MVIKDAWSQYYIVLIILPEELEVFHLKQCKIYFPEYCCWFWSCSHPLCSFCPGAMGGGWHFASITLKGMENLIPVLAGKEEVFLSLAERAVFRSKRKLYVIPLLTGWCVAFLFSDAGCYLQVLSLFLPHPPPSPNLEGSPVGCRMGNSNSVFPTGAACS